MSNRSKQDEAREENARQYIDRIIAINRRYSMGSDVSEEVYDRAVKSAVDAFKHLPAADNQSPSGRAQS